MNNETESITECRKISALRITLNLYAVDYFEIYPNVESNL